MGFPHAHSYHLELNGTEATQAKCLAGRVERTSMLNGFD